MYRHTYGGNRDIVPEIRLITDPEQMAAAADIVAEAMNPDIVRNGLEKEGREVLGAYVGEQLVGAAAIDPDDFGKGIATLHVLAVKPNVQDHNIGTVLLAHGENHAREAGQSTMRLRLGSLSFGLEHYYKKRGYVEDRGPHMRKLLK